MYGTENIIPYFRTVLFLKIPYVIPCRTICQNLTDPYRSNSLGAGRMKFHSQECGTAPAWSMSSARVESGPEFFLE